MPASTPELLRPGGSGCIGYGRAVAAGAVGGVLVGTGFEDVFTGTEGGGSRRQRDSGSWWPGVRDRGRSWFGKRGRGWVLRVEAQVVGVQVEVCGSRGHTDAEDESDKELSSSSAAASASRTRAYAALLCCRLWGPGHFAFGSLLPICEVNFEVKLG